MSDESKGPWITRKLAENEFPNTQLGYVVYDENYETISVHYQKKHAKMMAAFPLMLEALEAAREYVSNTTTDCRECGEPNSSSSRDKTIRIIDATIAAAKGSDGWRRSYRGILDNSSNLQEE